MNGSISGTNYWSQTLTKSALMYVLFFGPLGCNKQDVVVLHEFAGKRWVATIGQSEDPLTKRLNRAYLLYRDKRYADAARCAASLMETEHDTEALALQGLIFTRQGSYETAEKQLRAAITKDPDWEWLCIALIWTLCEARQYASAEQEAIALTDSSSTTAAWSALAAVRNRRTSARRWSSFFNFMMFIAIIGLVAVVIVFLVWLVSKVAPSTSNSSCSTSTCTTARKPA